MVRTKYLCVLVPTCISDQSWVAGGKRWRTFCDVSRRLETSRTGYGLSHWVATLHCNVVSHWLSSYPGGPQWDSACNVRVIQIGHHAVHVTRWNIKNVCWDVIILSTLCYQSTMAIVIVFFAWLGFCLSVGSVKSTMGHTIVELGVKLNGDKRYVIVASFSNDNVFEHKTTALSCHRQTSWCFSPGWMVVTSMTWIAFH